MLACQTAMFWSSGSMGRPSCLIIQIADALMMCVNSIPHPGLGS
jgi:hypothetical protein